MMTDNFQNYAASLRDPVRNAETVVPDDASDLSTVTRAIYVGLTGDIRATLVGGSDVTFRSLPVGWHPIRVQKIWATGTTASDIVACD